MLMKRRISMPVPKNFSTPIRMSAKEQALSQIQRWIIEGTLQPGEKLIDAELAESLSLSRTPIREAFQLLEVQGLVSMYPGKETKVTSIDKDDILKMYPTLAALHALAAEYAAKVILPAQIETLKELNAQFAKAIEYGQPYQAMELDEQFHNLIVEASDNAYVASFSASLQIHIRRFKYVFLKQPVSGTLVSVDEHASIILALEKHDAEAASAAMKQNLIRPMHELYSLI
jgi:DNA-binding GntR family transcriptional regulator